MPRLTLLAITPRTATILAAPEGARFAQPRPLDWRLVERGRIVAEGHAKTTVLFLDHLTPGTAYWLDTPLGRLALTTPRCAGLIDVTDHGARDGTHCTDAFASALDAVPEGGTLYVPAGRFETLPLMLKPAMTLHLDRDAILTAPASRENWPQLPARDDQGRVIGTWEGLPDRCFAALVTALDCPGLAITGRGTIDGGGDRGDWWTWPKETREGARRPRAVHLAYSDDVSLTGVTIRNAPSWTLHPYRCDRLTAAALVIQNPPDSPNTDGLNPESCRDVTIAGIDFSVGDDCIAIKAGKRAPDQDDHLAPTQDIRISHCRMQRGHGAVVIGSEMSGGVSDVSVSACDFIGTDRGLRLKTRRGRGDAIRNISLSDVVMQDVATPLAINAFYFCDADGKDDWVQSRAPAAVDHTTPQITGVTLTRVAAHGVTCAAAAILGLPEAPVTGVKLTEFTVSFRTGAPPAPPLMALQVPPVAAAGLLAEFAVVTGSVTEITTAAEAAC